MGEAGARGWGRVELGWAAPGKGTEQAVAVLFCFVFCMCVWFYVCLLACLLVCFCRSGCQGEKGKSVLE